MISHIPESDYDACIFDCDGTLADTMPLHYRAWVEALARQGAVFPEPLFYEMGGIPTVRIVELLNERFGYTMVPESTADEKEVLYLQLIPEVRPIQWVVDIVHRFHGRKPLAVASGGHRDVVRQTLTAIGIADRFVTIVGAEDYVNGKPAPDPYLEAAKRLGIAPEKCLVFEDTETGVRSATAAGMRSILVKA